MNFIIFIPLLVSVSVLLLVGASCALIWMLRIYNQDKKLLELLKRERIEKCGTE